MAGERASIGHGGNLDEASGLFPGAPEPWIDLSTGINPVPYPLPDLSPALFERLPAPAEQARLERAAARAYGASDPAMVVAAPGTQALIGWLPYLRPRSRVVVVGPTYAEHAQAWGAAGHEVREALSPETAGGADVVVLVNPNNPDGRQVPLDTLVALAHDLRSWHGWLVVDEAFADLEGEESLVPHLPETAIVLRSFGKAYGLAGLRLGFAVAALPVADALRAALGPWAVSGPALAIGRQALLDEGWRAAAAAARAADASRLDELLRPAARIVGGTSLFRLIESRQAPALFSHLGRNGIWVRRFREDPTRLRFGLPGSAPAWERLEAALGAFATSPPVP